MKIKTWIFSLLFIPIILLFTNFFSPSPDPVRAEILHEESSIEPGRPFWVGIHIALEPGWHIYWKNPGDAGMTPEVAWDLPEAFQISPLLWPAPQKFTAMEMTGFGYHNQATLLTQITPPSSLSDPIDIKAHIHWVACNESSCLPGETYVTARLPVKNTPPEIHPSHAPLFVQARSQIPQKIEGLKVERKGEFLSLHLPYELHHVEFYSENPGHIDEESEAVLVQTEQGTEILFKEKGGNDFLSLKGVLLLEGKPPIEIDFVLPHSSSDIAWNGENDFYETSLPIEGSPSQGLLLTLVFAFLGGLCLNGMPCVLPVVSFKVLNFIKIAGESRLKILKHSFIFTLGILLSFWILAAILLLLKAWGHSVGWGFQLQEPLFVAILAAIIFIFSLSLFGMFEFGTKIAAIAGQATAQPKTGLSGSFFSGVLATAVATPCSGPFLGTAIGLAATFSTFQAMTVFSSLALGMASPYLLFGIFPQLLRFMPKPGNWMITFKELMGWMMLATVLWLIWVFGAQTNSLAISMLLGSFFLIAIGCWIFGKWGIPFKKKHIRRIGRLISLLFFICGCYGLVQASRLSHLEIGLEGEKNLVVEEENTLNQWIPFSQKKLEELQKEGIPVFVDFTAKWCLTCQANHFVLEQKEVKEQFKKQGVVKMVADWTKRDPAITEALTQLGRNSVPVYALYGKKEGKISQKQPILLPQLLTQTNVMEYLGKIEETQTANR